jgi:hypothetical protein
MVPVLGPRPRAFFLMDCHQNIGAEGNGKNNLSIAGLCFSMKGADGYRFMARRPLYLFIMMIVFGQIGVFSQTFGPKDLTNSPWNLSIQYLGLTCHPHGGATPELYPLKFDSHAYLVLDVGAAGKLDYRLGKYFFARLTSALYLDCALLLAGCVHAGPRIQYSTGKNSMNLGIGPIFSFRQDWHRFKQFRDLTRR